MLNRSEQRRLRAIERSLEHDDPELVERLRTADWERPPDKDSRQLAAVTVFGLVVALFGLVLSPVVVLLGVAFAVAGLWSQLLANWGAEPPDEQDGSGGVQCPR